jgi:hypothetical protein
VKWSRTKLALLSTFFLIGGIAARYFLVSWPIAIAGPLPIPLKTSSDFEIQGVVSELRFPEQNDVIDVIATTDISKCYLVKLTPIQSVKGNFPERSLSILIHSPSLELGVRKKGQTISLELDRAKVPWTCTTPATSRVVPDLSRVKYNLFSKGPWVSP